MNDVTGWAAVGMAAVSNMATWLIIIKGNKAAKANGRTNNPGAQPGTGKICQERGEKIAVMNERQDNFEETMKEIKGDLKTIKTAVMQK